MGRCRWGGNRWGGVYGDMYVGRYRCLVVCVMDVVSYRWGDADVGRCM